MLHPLDAVPDRLRRNLLRVAVFLAVVASGTVTWKGWQLRNETAPLGISSLGLAPDNAAGMAIINRWKTQHAGISKVNEMWTLVQPVPKGLDDLAATVTLLKFGSTFFYCLAVSMACVWLGSSGTGGTLGWLIWLGGLLAAVENTLVLRALYAGGAPGALADATHYIAWLKFAIVGGCVGYAGWAAWSRWKQQAVR